MKLVITNMQFEGQEFLFCGLIDGTRLTEVRIGRRAEDPGSGGHAGSSDPPSGRILGNIYLGKVERIVEHLNAAFVNIAPGFPCFLPLEHVKDPIMVKSSVPGKIIQDDEILVQVSREAMGGKGPALTTNLNFAGRYAVLTTENRKFGVSSKLDGNIREHFKELCTDKVPDSCGLIIRTNARHASDEELLAEISDLGKRMEDVLSRANTRCCYSCLYRPDPLYLTYLMGLYTEGLEEIVTDLPYVYEALSAFCGRYGDLAGIPLRLYEDDSLSLTGLYNLNRELVRATSREVRLKSGGFLLIEPTEAMTVIDVNSGKSSSSADKAEHIRKINLEASREIALQLRLRNLSGIIIVDFIDLDTDERRRELLGELRSRVSNDPVPVTVHDITALDLVEITRKKADKSLSEQIKQLTINNAM